LYLQEKLTDSNNFCREYSWHNLPSPLSFPPHPMFASALPRECRTSEICVEICKNVGENISDIIDHNL